MINATPLTQAETSQVEKLRSMAVAIRGAMSPVVTADGLKAASQKAFQDDVAGSANARESVMVAVAKLSVDGNWTATDIATAAKLATEVGNAKADKAIATFIGECKCAMHPLARVYVPGIVVLRDAAWDAEAEVLAIDKAAYAPIKKAFARKYHLLLDMFREAGEGRYFRSIEDVIAHAEANDPDVQPGKVAKKLEQMVKDLTVIYKNFPHDDIKASLDQLATLDAKTLKATTQPVAVSAAPVSAPVSSGPTVVVDNSATVPAATPEPATPVAENMPAEGATGDLLDDVLSQVQGELRNAA